jgi:hypothetical protein
MLPGMSGVTGGAATGREPAGVTVVDAETNLSVNGDSWSVTVQLGAEPPAGQTRHIIVLWSVNDNDLHDSSVTFDATLGGDAVTKLKAFGNVPDGDNTNGEYIGIIEMPTGTSAQLVVTLTGFSGTMDAYAIGVLRAIDLDPTTVVANDVFTGFGIPSGDPIPLNVPVNGVGVIVGAGNAEADVGSWSGTGATTVYSGTRAGAAMYRTQSGTVNHDATNYTFAVYATWQFDS